MQEYVDAAHRNGALLVLDLQPGRASFLEVAKRWEWALVDPWVGLGLDTEWRMGPDEVPGRDIGSVSAREINKVSAWLSELVQARRLPEKVLLFHQYRTGNVRGISRVREPEGVAIVQHVDAPGSPADQGGDVRPGGPAASVRDRLHAVPRQRQPADEAPCRARGRRRHPVRVPAVGGQRPFHTGVRFSANARAPSRASSEP